MTGGGERSVAVFHHGAELVLKYTDQPFAILISAKAAYKMRTDPLSLESSAVHVLCLNLGRAAPSIIDEKATRAEMVGFLSTFRFDPLRL